jgi:uncharacterized protein (DUF362 family)/Pyruvate/2-oxoacid:ferredoxin oxidoreductase delta subunit
MRTRPEWTEVSLVQCKSYHSPELETAVKRAVDLVGGMSGLVKRGDRVLLKPNLLSAREPVKRITTDPAVVSAIARLVLDAGGRPFIGDSPGIDSFGRVAVKTGMGKVASELGIELLELTDSTRAPEVENGRFKRVEIARQALEADVVINLPKLKTHSQMLLTLGVKNLFGTVVAQRKAEWHHMTGIDRQNFASLHLDIYLILKPVITILDGVWGMDGCGPANGNPNPVGVIAAARDAVALDVSVCHFLGAPLGAFPLYREARARGIGETDLAKIRILGESPKILGMKKFQIPKLDSFGILPSVVARFAGRHLVSRPVQAEGRCVGCGHCAKICPADAIRKSEKSIRFDYDRCIRCYCCQEVCPEDAIAFRKGLLVRILNRFRR